MKGQQSKELPIPFNKWGCFVYSILWIAWFHCARIMYQEKRGPFPEFTDAMLVDFCEGLSESIDNEYTVLKHASLLQSALKYVTKEFGIDRDFIVYYRKMEHKGILRIRGELAHASVVNWARDVDGDGDMDYTHFTGEYGPKFCDRFNPLPGSYTVELGDVVNYRGFWIFPA